MWFTGRHNHSVSNAHVSHPMHDVNQKILPMRANVTKSDRPSAGQAPRTSRAYSSRSIDDRSIPARPHPAVSQSKATSVSPFGPSRTRAFFAPKSA